MRHKDAPATDVGLAACTWVGVSLAFQGKSSTSKVIVGKN